MWSFGDLGFGVPEIRSSRARFWRLGVLEFRRFVVQKILRFVDITFGTLCGTLLRGSSAEHANKERKRGL